MKCPKCGTENAESTVFCQNCGTSVAPAPIQYASVPPQAGSSVPSGGYQQPSTYQAPPQPQIAYQQPGAYQRPAAYPPQSFDWRRLLFMGQALEYVSHGSLFRRIVAGFIWTIAILSGIAVAVLLVGVAGAFFQTDSGIGILGGLLSIPLVVIYGYALVHTLILRARSVRSLPDSDYTIIPIMAVILRTIGETTAIYLIYMGVQVAIGMWFGVSGAFGNSFLPSYLFGGGYYGGGYGSSLAAAGFISLVSGLISAFVVLLIFYLFSESVGMFADIARDVRAMRNRQSGQ